ESKLVCASVRLLQLGLLACVLAYMRGNWLDIDRFDYPKELVFHCFALSAATLALLGTRRLIGDAVDVAWLGFVVLGMISALASVRNPWLAWRAVGLSASSVAVFWTARAAAARGYGRALLHAAAAAVVLAAATVLLESFGILDALPHRGPGGTLGNR